MKLRLKTAKLSFVVAGLMLGLGLMGCGTTQSPTTSNAAAPSPAVTGNSRAGSDVIRVGDPVSITFSGLATTDLPAPFSERLKSDGLIRLPLIREPIKAEGKTRGELEQEIFDRYVPKIFKTLTVKVAAEGRIVHVDGEVRLRGRVGVMGEMTVLKVIAAAGGFTDFANKKKVLVTRTNGQKIVVNCTKALDDPKLDLPIYPDDQIEVPRRLF